ncbi:MAG TPA: rhodanese-like domain-containing protein [Acidiferrobacteraceae bacterium]|nr:rhodanese-like domain-containing protein [Acidiferrobacteraceae bacterium]
MFNSPTTTIGCIEAKQLVKEAAAQLLDVRTTQEYLQASLPGAVNVPLAAIQTATIKLDKTKPVIVFCRSGQRSANACVVLEGMGFDTVHNLGAITKYLNC